MTVFIDVKVIMARLQMLGEKEKVEFINCCNDTNTINGILKAENIF